jgi:acylphosphatase
VRNRPDGTVVAELEGPAEEVELFAGWFAHGPPDARVDRLEVTELPPAGGQGFSVD